MRSIVAVAIQGLLQFYLLIAEATDPFTLLCPCSIAILGLSTLATKQELSSSMPLTPNRLRSA
jgi:hypothetical protein